MKFIFGTSTNLGPINVGRYKPKTYKRWTVQTLDDTNVGQYKPWTIQTLDQDSRRNSTDVGQRKIIILILDLKKNISFYRLV